MSFVNNFENKQQMREVINNTNVIKNKISSFKPINADELNKRLERIETKLDLILQKEGLK